MPSISAESRARLLPLLRAVDWATETRKSPSELGTLQSRAKHWKKFCADNLIQDETLCHMTEYEKNRIVASYAVYLSDGNTIKNKVITKSTLKLYLAVVTDITGVSTKSNTHNPKSTNFHHNTGPPTSEMIRNVIKEHGRWDKVKKKREPMSQAMVEEFRRQAEGAHPDSYEAALIDWLTIGVQAGFRKSEWLHDDTKPTEFGTRFHLNPDGSNKPFIKEDFSLEYIKEPTCKKFKKQKIEATTENFLCIKWRFQKNGDHGQMINFAGNPNKAKCVVEAARRITNRAIRLGLPPGYPIAAFGKNGKPVYMTGRMVQKSLRNCAAIVYKLIDQDILSRYTCHAIRVAGAVTLHCGGASDQTIMMRLRWKSGAFRDYLRNTPNMAAQHNKIVNNTDMDDMDLEESNDIENLGRKFEKM